MTPHRKKWKTVCDSQKTRHTNADWEAERERHVKEKERFRTSFSGAAFIPKAPLPGLFQFSHLPARSLSCHPPPQIVRTGIGSVISSPLVFGSQIPSICGL